MTLACLHATCAGRVLLRGGRKPIGTARHTAAPGARARVRVRLNRAGHRLLKARRRARVTVSVTVAGGTPVTRKLRMTTARAPSRGRASSGAA